MTVLLMLPAIAVTLCLLRRLVRHRGRARASPTGGIDAGGLALVTLAVGLVMAGLIAIRLAGRRQPAAPGR